MKLLTVEETAELLKVSRRHVDRMIKAGKLKATDVGLGSNHIWRIDPESIDPELQKPITKRRRKPTGIERFV